MERLDQRPGSSFAEAGSSADQKQRPRLIRQLVLAYSISAGLILITLIAQRTVMPILSQRYQLAIQQIWTLRLSIKQIENDLIAQESGLRAYVMSNEPESADTLTVGREQYLADAEQARALAEQVDDTALRASLTRMRGLAEQQYQSYGRSGMELRRNGRAALSLNGVEPGFGALRVGFADLEEKTVAASERIQDQLKKQRRNFLIIACSGYIIGVLVGLVALIRSIRLLSRPLQSLITAAQEIEQGNFSIRASGDPYEETAAVARAFNRMAAEIAAERNESRDLLLSLRKKNVELEEKHREVEQANQIKSQFLANVTHELRTPLSSMVLYTDMLLKGKMGPLAPTQQDALHTIMRRGKEQLHLVNELLDASLLDNKQASLKPARVWLIDLVKEAITIVQPRLESKRLRLEQQFPSDPVAVEADRARLLQVFNNLFDNAVKFTPPDGRILVNVTSGPEGTEIAITNSGEGIHPEDLPFIFDRFYRGRHSGVADSSGAGLGLFIANELLELHGGRLQARTNGEGETTFSFILPGQPAAAPKSEPAASGSPA